MTDSDQTTPKPSSKQKLGEVSDDIDKPYKANGSLTVLSEVAYPGPSKEILDILNSHDSVCHPQNHITIEDVIKGFRELGKDMSASDMLTVLLRALAKDETETLFDWLLWKSVAEEPKADGKGHWEQLSSVIPNLDKSWLGLAETYEMVVLDCSEDTEEEYPAGPTVTWSTISPNSQRHVTPESPVQPSPSPTRTIARPGESSTTLSPVSQRRKRTTPEPYLKPAIPFPKPLGENGVQEDNDSAALQHSKRLKLPPTADLPRSD